jgi:hypothetical protein
MNQENQEQLAQIGKQLSDNVCHNMQQALSRLRTEMLQVQERGNAQKAKERLILIHNLGWDLVPNDFTKDAVFHTPHGIIRP